MAKKEADDAFKDLQSLEKLAELSSDDRIKYIRKLERDLASTRTKYRDMRARCKAAEEDLRLTEATLDRTLYCQDNASVHKYEKAKKRGSNKGGATATAIVCANDWHTEQTIDPMVVCAANEFNLEIADRRIGRFWERAAYLIDWARQLADIKEIKLWAGGDLINGMIHEELQQTNAMGPTDATLHCQDHLVSGIRYLIRETKCDHLELLGNFGNHGRSTMKKRTHTSASHSWEYGMYHNAANIIRADSEFSSKFNAAISRSDLLMKEIQGYRCRFSHGDTIKYNGGTGGVTVPAFKRIAAWNKTYGHAELDVIGHFHQHYSTMNFVCCGCLCGYDPYAQSIGATAELPHQTLIIMDQAYGKILTLPIFVEDRNDARLTWNTPDGVWTPTVMR